MDYAQSLLLLVSVYAVSLVSPGPNFIIVTNTSMISRTAGLSAGAGLALASLTWAVMVMAGLGFLITHIDWLHATIQIVGALYLIWLGIKMIRHAAEPLHPEQARALSWQSAMRQSYLVSMTNPKSIAFFGSIFSLVMPTDAPIWFYAAIAAVCFLMSATWYCGLAFFFSNPRVSRAFARLKVWIDRTMGAALILLGGRLLWTR